MATTEMTRTIGEACQDTLKLRGYLYEQVAGAVISYHAIEDATGVAMNLEGKQKLRSALRMLRREFSTVRGKGLRLADENSALHVISTRIQRIDGAVKRADKSQKNLQEQFLASMPEADQKKLLFAGALFGAIRLAAEQGRNMHKKSMLESPTVSIPIPKF